MLIAVIATRAGRRAVGSLAAFALARYEFRGPGGAVQLLHPRPAVPGRGGDPAAVPAAAEPHLLDTPWAVAIPQAAFGLPVTIVILRPFMRTIPVELEDAAVIDGCTRLGFFWRILLPLSARR